MNARRLVLWAGAAGSLLLLAALGALVVAAQPPAFGHPLPAAAAQADEPHPAGGTLTATPSPTACALTYTYTVSAGVVVTSTDLVAGSQCPRCIVPLALPFPVTFYGQSYTAANVASYGNLQFVTADTAYATCPSPYPQLGPALFPFWADSIYTSWSDPCMANYGLPCGVFTSVSGSAPNRILNIEWRGLHESSNHETVDFEIRLREDADIIDFVYGIGIQFIAVVGVQNGPDQFTTYACNTDESYQHITIRWTPEVPATCAPAATPTGTPRPTQPPTRTSTPAPSGTATPTPPPSAAPTQTLPPSPAAHTATPTGTRVTEVTSTPSATATPCLIAFSDVTPADYFYTPVTYLYCHGVISGYGDNTFRPYNKTTRSQMVKIVVLGFGVPITTPSAGGYTFADVPPDFPFYSVIETAAAQNIISGYTCGGPGEPCNPQSRPYFRPFANVTRGQLAKIVVLAAAAANHWALLNPATPTFTDVPPASPFYPYVETAVCHGIVSGYADGTFRPGNDATRGQIAKIAYLAVLNQGTCPNDLGSR